MTKLERATRRAIREWCEEEGYVVEKIAHTFPRAYVVARPTSGCLVVACCPADAEPHIVLDHERNDGSKICHESDNNLIAGDWCSVAYVTMETWSGWVAIPAVVVED